MRFILGTIAVITLAGETPPPTPYSGDVWTRSTLTGDWWGLRNDLAAKGVTIDVSLTQAAQGIVHGGKHIDESFSRVLPA